MVRHYFALRQESVAQCNWASLELLQRLKAEREVHQAMEHQAPVPHTGKIE